MNLVEFVFKAAADFDRWNQTAVLCEGERMSYAELLRLVKKCGGMLRSIGIEAGDRVAIVACDSAEFVITFLGAAAVGAVAVPVSTMLAGAELEYVLNHCGARALVITSDQIEKLEKIRTNLTQLESVLIVEGEAQGALNFDEELARASEASIEKVSDETLAFILYTSGSTGRPKGAMHCHRNLPYTVETFCRKILRVEPGDRLFSSSRLFFAYGLGNSLSFPLSSGATAVLCKQRPTPQLIAEVFKRDQPTIFFGVPAVYRALIEYGEQGHRLETGAIKFGVSAGEKLPERIYEEWQQLTGLEILDGIGSTEMLQMFISNSRERIKPGSSGRVVPGYEARLVDQEGREIEGAGEGHLLIKGLSMSPGYWNDPEKTAAAMAGEWMRTGDIYRRDADEDYWFEGRSDDLFKVKGLWVSPIEIEDALLSCAEVSEAAVVSETDQNGLNAVAAYVVLKSKTIDDRQAIENLKAQLSGLLPPYKRPAEIYLLDQLPRTATGKLQRFKLRDKGEKACLPAPSTK